MLSDESGKLLLTPFFLSSEGLGLGKITGGVYPAASKKRGFA
jgi:hypothetical protein